ncbi:hypothetical protein HY414_00750 [Candidatus Kaiserbacteria bacterium]|nr:hypothetical protein [Candidatus Kaiserbacteria bacterium]
MGFYLVQALQSLTGKNAVNVQAVVTTRAVFHPRKDGWSQVQSLDQAPATPVTIAHVLDPYVHRDHVDFLYTTTPADPAVERAYMDYARKHQIYYITIAKGALGDMWEELDPDESWIGYRGTVGGRSLTLPFLAGNHLQRKQAIVYGYWNASVATFMAETARGLAPHEAFRLVQSMRLAEPGSNDYVSFLNLEAGGDYPRKTRIAYNSSIPERGGPYLKPEHYEKYIELGPEHIREHIRLGHRFVVCISTVEGYQPLKVERGAPGSLYAELNGHTIAGGFVDVKSDVNLAGWIKDMPASNGVKIIFQNGHNETGQLEIAGPGAGPDTVWAAIIDMQEHFRRRGIGSARLGSRERPYQLAHPELAGPAR